MKVKFIVLIFMSSVFGTNVLEFDFGNHSDFPAWFVVNDGVMGGLSQSELVVTPSSLLLVGDVSLENNGGFASMRSPYQEFNLSRFKTVTIRYKSKGQDMGFVLAPYKRWYYPNYKTILPASKDEWTTTTVNLSEFQEYKIGRSTGRMTNDTILQNVIRLGFITNSKKAGSFMFEVDFIKFE